MHQKRIQMLLLVNTGTILCASGYSVKRKIFGKH